MQFFDHLGPLFSTSACLPGGWAPDASVFFSPGLCPLGYETACSSFVSLGSETETRATCCPRYVLYQAWGAGGRTTELTRGILYSGYGCQTDTVFPWYATDICSVLTEHTGVFVYTTSTPGLSPETVTETGRYGFNAYGIQVRWQSTDLAAATATRTRSDTIIAPSSLSSGHASPDGRVGQKDETQRGGLATGAGIGIGVGVTIGGVLVVAAVLYYSWFRKRLGWRFHPAVSSPRELPAQHEPPELWAPPPEIDSRQK